MNWTELKTDFPKAWQVFWEEFAVGFELDSQFNELILNYDGRRLDVFDWRSLYDFLDQQGIMVTVEYDSELYVWYWYIFQEGTEDPVLYSKTRDKSRANAEKDAFRFAFNYLNSILTV